MKKRKNALVAIIVIFSLILAGAAGFLVFKTINTRQAENDYNKLASSFAPNLDETTGVSGESNPPAGSTAATQGTEAPLADNPVDLRSLMSQNSDIYSWIYIPGTEVNYPVAQSSVSDDFYLHSDIYKNYSFPGTIFSQSCNSRDWSDRVTVLYGHNMLNGSMFATLHRFENTDFFNEHRYIYIYTENRKLTYEVVSAFVYDDRHIMNSFNFGIDETFNDWLEEAKNPRSVVRNVNDSVQLSLDSKMLVLSTCNDNDIGRYLVQGVLIKDERTQ